MIEKIRIISPAARPLLAMLVVVMLAGGLTACGDASDSGHQQTKAEATTQTATQHPTPQLNKPLAASLMKKLKTVSLDSLASRYVLGKPSLMAIDGPSVRPKQFPVDLPTVFYVGGDFCPYCAAIRWPLVLSLMRFGDFSGLEYMKSASDDAYPNTVTVSFYGSHYVSDYLNFESVESADRVGDKLEKLDKRQMKLFQTFNNKPYTKHPGGIPFLYFNGRYMKLGSPFSPALIKGMSWQQVAAALQEGKSKASQRILAITNLYSAAVCQLTDGKPTKVCQSPAIKTAAKALPTKQ